MTVGSPKLLFAVQRKLYLDQIRTFSKSMASEVWWQRFDEDPIIVPQEMKTWIFCDHYISSSNDLMVKRGYVGMSRTGDEKEDGSQGIQSVMKQLAS
jgi:hypothetical protein